MNEIPANKKRLIPVDTIIGITNGNYHGKLMTFHVFYGNACLPANEPMDRFVLISPERYESILRSFLESEVGQQYYVPSKSEIYQDTAQTFEKIKNHEYDDRIALFYSLNNPKPEEPEVEVQPETPETPASEEKPQEEAPVEQETAVNEQEHPTTEENFEVREQTEPSEPVKEETQQEDSQIENDVTQENLQEKEDVQPSVESSNDESTEVTKLSETETKAEPLKEEASLNESIKEKEEPSISEPEPIKEEEPQLEVVEPKIKEAKPEEPTPNVTAEETFTPKPAETLKVEPTQEIVDGDTFKEEELPLPESPVLTEEKTENQDITKKEEDDFLEQLGVKLYDPHKYDMDNFVADADDEVTDVVDEVEFADTNDIETGGDNPWARNAAKYQRRKVVNSSDFNSVMLEKVLNIDKRLNKYLDDEKERFYVPNDLVPAEQEKEMLEMVKAELVSVNEKMDTYKKGHKTIATLNLVLFILQILMFAGIAFMFLQMRG